MAAVQSTRAWWCSAAEDRAVYTRQARQMSLFETAPKAQSNGQEAFRDPAFSDNRSLPIHRWVPWIAGYSAAFVDDVISAYIPAGKTALVLDPFCGVGTTLLQAVLRGHKAIGFEINPYPVLATHAKLSAPTIDLAELDATLKARQALSGIWRTTAAPRSIVPRASNHVCLSLALSWKKMSYCILLKAVESYYET